MDNFSVARSEAQILETNKVLKNTYILLSATLIFSAIMAAAGMAIQLSFAASMGCSLGALALIWFVLPRTAHKASGLWVVFAVTGLLGLGLGPVLNHYLAMSNGSQIITTAFGGTGVVFLALSGYALTSRKDFSFMAGFLMVGLVTAIIAMVANIFLQIPALSLAISSVVILIMSGMILFETSQIIRGGQTNYILATVSLYLSIYNIFVHLLHLLSAFSGND